MSDNENPKFRRSSRCGESGCVEVAGTTAGFLMRDSKLDESPVLAFTSGAWADFIAGVRDGGFD